MKALITENFEQLMGLSTAAYEAMSNTSDPLRRMDLRIISAISLTAMAVEYDHNNDCNKSAGNDCWWLLARKYLDNFESKNKPLLFDEWANWAVSPKRTADENLSFFKFNSRKGG